MPEVIQFIGKEPAFWCPGCREVHVVWVEKPNPITGSIWGWNRSMDKPTFTPSILVRGRMHCHSFVRDGQIAFLDDCTHELRNRTVDLQPMASS